MEAGVFTFTNLFQNRGTRQRFARLYIPSFILIAVVFGWTFHSEWENKLELIQEQQAFTIKSQIERLNREFSWLSSDILSYLSHQEMVYFLNGQSDSIHELSKELLRGLKIKSIYDQIRFLDSSGQELLRINYNNGQPAIVPQAQLQNKSDRYYFKETIQLKPNQIYVSPFDLNVENGKVEVPYKPMLRFATPVSREDGSAAGIIIVNYFGERVLKILHETSNSTVNMLLNADGYWLKAPQSEWEWGFMFNDRQHRFEDIYPDAWKVFKRSESGAFQDSQGLFTFHKFRVVKDDMDTNTNSVSPLMTLKNEWIFVVHTPATILDQKFNAFSQRVFMIVLPILLLHFLACSLLAITFERLSSAKNDAIRANESKSDFLANMSHEIRTPISSVAGLVHLLKKNNPTLKQREYIEKMETASQILLGIVNDILDLSKMESGKFELDEECFVFDEVLEAVRSQLTFKAERKGLAFVIEKDALIPFAFKSDSLRLCQVFLNLAGNAIKFTHKGEVRIGILLLEETDDTARLYISVRDTGIGLTQEQTQLLFQPFQQADISTTKNYGGTGLGLSICKKIIDAMNGEIGVKSEPDVGSEFWFKLSLPICRCKDIQEVNQLRGQATNPSINSGDEEVALDLQKLSRATVLLVEDHQVNREIVREILQQVNITVIIAENGQEAYDKICELKGKVDVVLMDLQMPIMDGYTALKSIRALEYGAEIVIVALTANVVKGEREKCIGMGFNDYVSKPINVKKLYATIEHFVKEKPKVLIVDTDGSRIKALNELLKQNCEVVFATNVQKAEQLILKNTPTVLICQQTLMNSFVNISPKIKIILIAERTDLTLVPPTVALPIGREELLKCIGRV